MLILTRHVGETLNIADNITVTVLGVKGNQVRIGIVAPKDVPVHRQEIYERIQRGKPAPSIDKQCFVDCIGLIRDKIHTSAEIEPSTFSGNPDSQADVRKFLNANSDLQAEDGGRLG